MGERATCDVLAVVGACLAEGAKEASTHRHGGARQRHKWALFTLKGRCAGAGTGAGAWCARGIVQRAAQRPAIFKIFYLSV
jgi:hypothetical protein